jgi:hypothetical protein
MPKVRTNPADKWQRRASQATDDFVQGVESPRQDWKTATIAAAKNQETGILEAIKDKRFERGVAKAGSEKWKAKTISKGSARFAQGVQEGVGDYALAIAPYLQVIEQTNLPPRYPKGDPRNIDRVKAISQALRNKKTKG